MERKDITRSYLETLSSADLNDLADEYGIDIPEDLTRRFIIAELLEAAAEHRKSKTSDLYEKLGTEGTENGTDIRPELPFSYNENKITAVLRNPAWCYVYWDIKKSDFSKTTKDKAFIKFILRISYFRKSDDINASDIFDISVENADRDQYILLSSHAHMLRVSLIAEFADKRPLELCQSACIPIPQQHPDISSISLRKTFSPVFTLSGLPELIRSQYNEHRQSFLLDE
ncbi:DUF4912 domain-containing protein [Treponema sp. OMZ 840]|uniref:DUF4912 domain-containing protein n=1 Tax=Treponema sp. OMZ 840 TaxID=244313 RepID=UPI003D8D87E1